MDKKMTLGGFEAVLDSFIPNPDGGFRNSNIDENVNVNADELNHQMMKNWKILKRTISK